MKSAIGKSLDGLHLDERWKLVGAWMATELYSPQRLPLRIIQAIGLDAAGCVRELRAQGRDPELFEYSPIAQPYQP